jgi:hypothetical protein
MTRIANGFAGIAVVPATLVSAVATVLIMACGCKTDISQQLLERCTSSSKAGGRCCVHRGKALAQRGANGQPARWREGAATMPGISCSRSLRGR